MSLPFFRIFCEILSIVSAAKVSRKGCCSHSAPTHSDWTGDLLFKIGGHMTKLVLWSAAQGILTQQQDLLSVS